MKHMFKQALALASLALLSATAAAGITTTPHNLTSTGAGVNQHSGTDQICVFCHTPHGADNTAAAPLWNKTIPASGSYTTYDSLGTSSLDGEVLDVGSVSAACLSCHDGTQAMDNMMNAPGSGNTALGTAGWTGARQSSGKLTGIANLGQDLSNDHPIGIEYCGGGVTGTGSTVSGACKDADFVTQTAVANRQLQTRSVNSKQIFWVDVPGGTLGTREKSDIALFTRAFAGAVDRPSVECASCHDPHQDKATNGDDVHFMRVATDGSGICLACHVK